MNRFLATTLTVVSSALCTLYAYDWPCWRGPGHNGISMEKEWDPLVLQNGNFTCWRINVGKGHSSVAVRGRSLYTMGNMDDKDTVYCLDAGTGKEIWRFAYPCRAGNYPGPRSTPVLEGPYVYTLSREGHLFCLDATEGTRVWKTDIIRETHAKAPLWGFSSSPRIEGELVLINACASGIALDRKTGKKVWASETDICGYASPVVYEADGKKLVIFFGSKAVNGVDLFTGKVLWSYPWITNEYFVNCADPVVVGSRVFISSGYGKGCALIDIVDNKPELVWSNKNMRSHFSTNVYLNGYFYGGDGNTRGSKRAGRDLEVKCVDANTGDTVWAFEFGLASLIAADEKLIIINEDGELLIMEATEENPKVLSRAQIIEASGPVRCWTAPVLSNGRIYCRSSIGDLVCIDMNSAEEE